MLSSMFASDEEKISCMKRHTGSVILCIVSSISAGIQILKPNLSTELVSSQLPGHWGISTAAPFLKCRWMSSPMRFPLMQLRTGM